VDHSQWSDRTTHIKSLALANTLVPPTTISFFFNDTATPDIYTLSLHDALPIYRMPAHGHRPRPGGDPRALDHQRLEADGRLAALDRKSTRLNSSHSQISYAVFCLKKKKQENHPYAGVPAAHGITLLARS